MSYFKCPKKSQGNRHPAGGTRENGPPFQPEWGWWEKPGFPRATNHGPSALGEAWTHISEHSPWAGPLTFVHPEAGRALVALDSTARKPKRRHPGPPQPSGHAGLAPVVAQQSLHPEAWGEVHPRGSQGAPKRCGECCILPSPSRDRREEERVAAERANWRLILNCSKMSRGSGAPPGPTPENTKAWASSHGKLPGPGPAESWLSAQGSGGRWRGAPAGRHHWCD